jgi:hypothetical protein
MNASTSTFNPEVFLNSTTTEENSTELLAVPEGEYLAVSGPISAESFRSYDIKKGDRAGQKGYALDITWNINDESGALKEFLGRAPTARQSIMLDMKIDGGLEFGKGRNVGLGRLREALGQNLSGRPWSFAMLGAQVAKIKVGHRIDNSRTYVEVKDVTKA